jgi:hypothetical protein
LPPDQLAQSRAMRARAAADGLRKPVQVMEGNYAVAERVCPWWERTRGGSSN